jgi:hypothetical protein
MEAPHFQHLCSTKLLLNRDTRRLNKDGELTSRAAGSIVGLLKALSLQQS